LNEVIDLGNPYNKEKKSYIRKFFSMNLPEDVKIKTVGESKSDYYEGILEVCD